MQIDQNALSKMVSDQITTQFQVHLASLQPGNTTDTDLGDDDDQCMDN
jgi:hypothetical protein